MKDINIRIYKLEVEQYTDPAFPHGKLNITYELNQDTFNRKEINYDLISVWIDPSTPRTPFVIKAHATVPKIKDITSARSSHEKMQQLQRFEFARMIQELRNVDGSHHSRFLSVDEFGDVIRYGPQVINDDGSIFTSIPEDNRGRKPIFDTKAAALSALMNAIQQEYKESKIVGLDLVNFNSIEDTIMEELGFTKVPDRCNVSPAMWMGDPKKMVRSNESSDWSEGYYERMQKRKAIVESFLDVLEAALV